MAAGGAQRACQGAVHVQHPGEAGGFVQAVHILGDQNNLAGPLRLQPGQGGMCRIGLRAGGLQAPGIVEPVHKAGVAGKGFGGGDILDPVPRPEPAFVPEGAEPAFRGNACAGQNHDFSRQVCLLCRPRRADEFSFTAQ